jgi:ectoine hydroxylase-related dioxygenase (phytanoyl-CoA dioxygenase family)
MFDGQSGVNASDPVAAGEEFRRLGYTFGPKVLPHDLIRRCDTAMDDVMDGRYDTGDAPLDLWWTKGDDPSRLRKIDQAHVASRVIHETVTHPALGRWIGEALGVDRVQVWCVQLLHKPGAGGDQTTVGWHQDYQYWRTWWRPESEVFTCWLALSDVTVSSGPMAFVPRSHEWGLLEHGDFFADATDTQIASIPVPDGYQWEEVSAVMPAGAFSLHHRLTFHGSRANTSGVPRRSFAIHMCTERAVPTLARVDDPHDPATYDYVSHLDNPAICPIVYQRPN